MKYVYLYIGIGVAIVSIGTFLIFYELANRSPLTLLTDKEEYKIGEPIRITVNYIGMDSYPIDILPVSFFIYDEKYKLVCNWVFAHNPLSMIAYIAQRTLTVPWDQKDCTTGKQVSAGIYTVKTIETRFNETQTSTFTISD
jgi:hypothetical protein